MSLKVIQFYNNDSDDISSVVVETSLQECEVNGFVKLIVETYVLDNKECEVSDVIDELIKRLGWSVVAFQKYYVKV